MTTRTPWLKTAAALTIAISLIASGCGNGANNDAGGGNEAGLPSASAAPSESPDASKAPETAESGEAPTPSASPDETEAPASPSATADPDRKQTASPTAEPTAKPSQKPAEKPSATAKPSLKPTAKPTAKPAPKPTAKPSAKPSPTAKPEKPGDNLSVTDIMDNLTGNIELPALIEVSGDQIKDAYYFDGSELLAGGVFKQALMNTKATELVVVKLKSAEHYDAVKEGLTKRAEDIIKTFSTYLQDQYEDAKNYQILRNGLYVMLSISHDQDAIKTAFEASFD